MPANIAFCSLFVAVMVSFSAGPANADSAFTQVRLHADSQAAPDHRLTTAAQNESRGDPLEPGKTIERDLAGGESHSYLIKLTSGLFLQAIITQRQMDLTAALF